MRPLLGSLLYKGDATPADFANLLSGHRLRLRDGQVARPAVGRGCPEMDRQEGVPRKDLVMGSRTRAGDRGPIAPASASWPRTSQHLAQPPLRQVSFVAAAGGTGTLDAVKLRLAFVVRGAANRVDWHSVSLETITTSGADLSERLLPMLRRDLLPANPDIGARSAALGPLGCCGRSVPDLPRNRRSSR